MKKVNVRDIEEISWTSPKGKFGAFGKEISVRHPFDVELTRIAAGGNPFPFHSHSAQWEFYYVVAGSGTVRHDDGSTEISTGDAFLFKPGEAHGFVASAHEDLTMIVVADNPIGESTHYPDSGKWAVRSPERRTLRSEHLDYYDGEE